MDKTDSILIWDIETDTHGGKPNPKTDTLKVFGCYSYLSKKYYCLTDHDQIRKVIQAHKFLVGFNTKQYDTVVMNNNGFDDLISECGQFGDCTFNYKINIDMFEIVKKRAGAMKVKKGMLGDLL